MKALLEFLKTLIPFLAAYPWWIKWMVGIWILFSAVLVICLVFTPKTSKSVTATQELPQDLNKISGDSRESIDLSLNSIRIYLIEVAKNMYQVGVVCEIANLDQSAHLVKDINFNGDAYDIAPRAPFHFRKALLQEDIIKGQIIGDNFLAPNKNKFFKVMLPLKIEMVIDYQPPPEIIFWGGWDIRIENQLISLLSNFYGNYDKTITIKTWENVLKSVSDINLEEISLKITPNVCEFIDKYYNFMLFNPDRTAKIDVYGFDKTIAARSDNGVLVFLRGPCEPPLTGGWIILGRSYPEVWANPKRLAIYTSVYPPGKDGNLKAFGVFAGCSEEMGVAGSAPTTRGGDILRFKGLRERSVSDLTSPLQFTNFRSTIATYVK